MKQSKKIAITGGIGSGKSIVCELLRKKGYVVFSCDEISRALWTSEEYRKGLTALFPTCAERGEIVKDRLTAHVFSDKKELERLNAYAHPRIMQELIRRMEACEFSFAEVPLLFEEGYETLFDDVIAVVRNEGERIAAVAVRDGLSEDQIKLRMAHQFDPARLNTKDCFVLENNGSIEDLECRLNEFLDSRRIL